jgi:hypothetical protein
MESKLPGAIWPLAARQMYSGIHASVILRCLRPRLRTSGTASARDISRFTSTVQGLDIDL